MGRLGLVINFTSPFYLSIGYTVWVNNQYWTYMTKLHEHNGRQYEILDEDGLDIIKSDDDPGPGWIELTPERKVILQDLTELADGHQAMLQQIEDMNERVRLMVAKHDANK
jgi:hypothetical protein